MTEFLNPLFPYIVPLLLLSECLRVLNRTLAKSFPQGNSIEIIAHRGIAFLSNVAAAIPALTIGLGILEDVKPENVLLITSSLALAAMAYAAMCGAANMGLFAMLVVIFTPVSAVQLALYSFDPVKTWISVVFLGVLATGGEARIWGARPGLTFLRLAPSPYLLYGVFACICLIVASLSAPSECVGLAVVGLAASMALLTSWLHKRAMVVCSTALLCVATFVWVIGLSKESMGTLSYATCISIMVTGLAGNRIIYYYKPFPGNVAGRILLVLAGLVFVCFLWEIVLARGD